MGRTWRLGFSSRCGDCVWVSSSGGVFGTDLRFSHYAIPGVN